MQSRLNKFSKSLKKTTFVVSNPVNIYYLSGFKGVSPIEREAILIFNPKPHLITAKLYQSEAKNIARGKFKVLIAQNRHSLLESVQKLLTKSNMISFEEDDLKFAEYKILKKIAGKRLVPKKNILENSRVYKTEEEIKLIEKAQKISQNAFHQVIKTISPGKTEQEISETLTKIIKSIGGQGLAFESIVASGKGSAQPHYLTGRKRVQKNSVLLFDFGAKYKDYCADLSRTIFVGKQPQEIETVYDLVQTA